MEKYLEQLIGKKVAGIIVDSDDRESNDTTWGLRFSDNTLVWILRDPEGNGPGFLEIEKSNA